MNLGERLRLAARTADAAPLGGPHVRLLLHPEGVHLEGRWLTHARDAHSSKLITWAEIEEHRNDDILATAVEQMLEAIRFKIV